MRRPQQAVQLCRKQLWCHHCRSDISKISAALHCPAVPTAHWGKCHDTATLGSYLFLRTSVWCTGSLGRVAGKAMSDLDRDSFGDSSGLMPANVLPIACMKHSACRCAATPMRSGCVRSLPHHHWYGPWGHHLVWLDKPEISHDLDKCNHLQCLTEMCGISTGSKCYAESDGSSRR